MDKRIVFWFIGLLWLVAMICFVVAGLILLGTVVPTTGAVVEVEVVGRNVKQIQTGQKVLIHEASGGVGTFAVQIAKAFGSLVTAVRSTRNVDLVHSLGADQVVDYMQEDFTKTVRL